MIWPFGRRPDLSEYIGTVHAYSITKDEDGNETNRYWGRWILTMDKRGRRCSELVGNPHNSAFATEKKSEVSAWLSGGPLPELDNETRVRPTGNVLRLVSENEGDKTK